MEKKNVVIYVAGQRFSISTSDTPEYVLGIGEKIDVMIKGIQKDNPKLNRDACAILAALNICDDETKLRQMMEVLRGQVKDYLDSNEKLRAENDALKEELKALKGTSPAVSAPAHDTSVNEASAEDAPLAPAVVPSKAEEAVASAVQRQTAFTGKNFSSDHHKSKKNKHKHQKQNYSAPATPAVTTASTAPADADEAQADDASPYHQFSIFDDLI